MGWNVSDKSQLIGDEVAIEVIELGGKKTHPFTPPVREGYCYLCRKNSRCLSPP